MMMCILCGGALPQANAQVAPSQAYLFAYGTEKNGAKNGLHYAWSIDAETWQPIGDEYSWIKSDYSRWGNEKRMYSPFLYRDAKGIWQLVFSLNDHDGAIAHAFSKDLVYWSPQSYIPIYDKGNCRQIEISGQSAEGFTVGWEQESEGKKTFFEATTPDFTTYSTPGAVESRQSHAVTAQINGRMETGTIHRVTWEEIEKIRTAFLAESFKQVQNAESLTTDLQKFARLEPVQAEIRFDTRQGKAISDMLIGVFFEDINYAADGGLYGELIQNRGFEYNSADNKNWDARTAWSFIGKTDNWKIGTENPVHPNNPHCSVITITRPGEEKLVNTGFDGITLKAGKKYDLSFFARTPQTRSGRVKAILSGKDGEIYAQTFINCTSGDSWRKYEAVLTAKADASNASLELIPQTVGEFALDMVSLFARDTFKGRKNGLRSDLAQVIADMKPRFVRFPGGCVAHGDGIENIYHWKRTVGPLEARVPQRNQWGYHQSAGLGYFEYFQFCEDIGAEAVPVVAAGVPCQNSAHHGHLLGGQQCGIPLDQMDDYIRDVLDLIEYANGDKNTRWGKVRAQSGHPEPFHLKYIGIGNEDQITPIFEERFKMIYLAVKEKYPEIHIIGTAGPFYQGTDYTEGWRIAHEVEMPLIDEHYYNTPGWFINNPDFYDNYDRSKTKVYLGEYACHVSSRHNNIETALVEALYLTSLERNADVVEMTSYAPLLAKHGHTQWNPDLIYFDNNEVFLTPGYYVQKLYGNNPGDFYIHSQMTLSHEQQAVRKRIGISMVRESRSGELIVKLVNVLPVDVNTRIEIDTDTPILPDALKTVLTGELADKNAAPVSSSINVGQQFDYEMPAHSLTVIRVKTGKIR